MPRLLETIEYRNPNRARLDAEKLETLSDPIITRIRGLLESLPDPDEALHFLERFRRESSEAFEPVCASPTALRYLLTLFSYSSFLAEAAIQHPEWVIDLAESGDMHRVLTAEAFSERLGRAQPSADSARDFARFRRRELMRIVLRDALGFASLSDVTEEISNLADAIVSAAYHSIRTEAERQWGAIDAGFSVIALGKLGGRELNYSSDIDLMFVYSGADETSGGLTAKEFFKKIANEMTSRLSAHTSEGVCYRVDLRLRPEGRLGEVCQPLEGAKNYYRTRARDWELQMLIKARVAAGEREPGEALLDFAEPLTYSTTLDFKAIESVSEARQRIHEKLKRSNQAALDVKLTRGGIRDIEFLAQCLQRLHGGREQWVRHGGTQMALFRLHGKDLLSDAEYARLSSAYEFLRHLEHRLQFQEDRQTHLLPSEPAALDLLARKMPAAFGPAAERNAGTLARELDAHLTAVQELYERVIHSQRPFYEDMPRDTPQLEIVNAAADFPSANLARFLAQKTPGLAAQLAAAGIARDGERLERFLEKAVAQPELLARLEDSEEVTAALLDLFQHSHFFGDQFVRYPELVEEVNQACGVRQGRVGFVPPEDVGALHRFFREQMVRIQSDSVYHRAPIFKTLKRTSDLADAVIESAYRIAVGSEAAPHMMVIALGRLGMREFDLASDADLVFVIPDSDAGEIPFWTSAAERLIHAVSAYTGDGVMFTVDARLRPNGREGALVQTEGAFREYFAHHAEAWEGISYMKARAVAGDLERATQFLTELQEIDWRRYGQSGRSRKQLAEMRARLEKEQGVRNPLKAGPGGYYDIDFALLYYRLKSAGMFYKVLNTPERIDILEKMGHLEREDAAFLNEAATFYRAVDHGLRIATGHAEGRIPTAPSQLAVLSELVPRWDHTGTERHALDMRLKQIRQSTRRFYEQVFGSR